MAIDLNLAEQELLAETLERHRSRLTSGELRAGLMACASLFIASGLIALASPPSGIALSAALLSGLVLVAASRVQFDTPFGFTVPIQLGFVPLLFSMPVSLVPVAVMVTLVIARVPEVVRGKVPAARLLQVPINAWFAVGPAAVLALAHVEAQDAGIPLLVGALVAQFAVDFVVSSLRYAALRGATLASQLRETWVYGVDAGLSPIALIVARDLHAHPLSPLALLPLLGLIALFAHERHRRLENLLELNSAYRGTALVLGDVVEADDGYTGRHSRGVVALALEVGVAMGLEAEQRRNLEFAALLHDVGKIAIPKEIVNKPGRLNPEEWTIIKTHTIEGQQMLERVGGFMREVGVIVRSHHERWDGRGYPDGLAGEAIPLEARIIACCDSWNAMRTDRPYRSALSHQVAVAELRANSGSQFDPLVVEVLLRVVAGSDAPLPASVDPPEPSSLETGEASPHPVSQSG
jgi:putative nucleotidyltransferase with HDIG domain